MTLLELITHRQTTQAELARRVGMRKQNLNKYVQGLRAPKYETAKKFADALNAQPIPPKEPGAGWTRYKPDANQENGEK